MKGKLARAVNQRSWQAVIVLTDDGVKAAQHVMPIGTQLCLLLLPEPRWWPEPRRLEQLEGLTHQG
jgi:hypothetical protein